MPDPILPLPAPAGLLAAVAAPPPGDATRVRSGVYEGEAGGAPWRVHVDVDGPSPLSLISGDVPLPDRVHFVARLTAAPDGWTFAVDRGAAHHDGALRFDGAVAVVTLGGATCRLTRVRAAFRELDIRVSVEAGRSLTGVLGAGLRPEIVDALDRAGVAVRASADDAVVLESTFGTDADRAWDNIELHDAMLARWAAPAGPGFRVWALVASTYEGGNGTAGIMFDGPSSKDQWQRQGFAVFAGSALHHQAPAFNPWSGQFPAGDVSFFEKIQRFTFLHELGHALNLAHSWQKLDASIPAARGWAADTNRPAARSWMNYPDRVAAFFATFDGRYDGPELAFLRHAPAEYVMMGGRPFFVDHGLVAGGPVEVRVVGRTSFDLLEPPRLTIALRNLTDQAILIPGFGDRVEDSALHVHLLDERRTLRPYTHALTTSDGLELPPGAELWVDRYVGGEPGSGAVLAQPGQWRVQVGVEGADGLLGLSEVVTVTIGEPTSREAERLLDAWSGEGVARLYRFNGSHLLTATATQTGLTAQRRSGLPKLATAGDVVRRAAAYGGPDAQLAARAALVGAYDRERRVALPQRVYTVDAQPLQVARVAAAYAERRDRDPLAWVQWTERAASAALGASKVDLAARLLDHTQPDPASLPTALGDRLSHTIDRVRRLR